MKSFFSLLSMFWNTLYSGFIGLGVLIILEVALHSISLADVFRFFLLGAIVGTVSSLISGFLFTFFGKIKWIAYLSNGIIVAIIVPLLAWLFFGVIPFKFIYLTLITLVASELISIVLVYRGISEFQKLEVAIMQRRAELEENDD